MEQGVLIALFGGIGVSIAEILKVIVEGIMANHGKGRNAHIDKRIDNVEKAIEEGFRDVNDQIADVRFDVQLERVKNARIRILRYSDEITTGVEHSKESFDQTLIDMDEYEDYCRLHPEFENNRTVLANQRIRGIYTKLLKENKFL